jgi:hypothetical protein
MGVNISGSGILSGIGSLIAGAVQSFNLLITKIIGYTNTGGGGSSYYTTTVGFDGPGLVTVDYNGITAYSPNGKNWSYGTNLEGSNWVTVFSTTDLFPNGLWVGVNDSGNTAYSEDGASWTYGDTLDSVFTDTLYVYNNNFIIFNRIGKTYKSVDGASWTFVSNLNSSGWSIPSTFGNNKFVSRNNAGQFAHSTDGFTWALGTNAFEEYQYSFEMSDKPILYGNGKFVAISNEGRTLYSTDGENWLEGTYLNTLGINSVGNYLTFANGVFVGRADQWHKKTFYSTDGITWSLGTDLGTATVNDYEAGWLGPIVFEQGLFVTVGYWGQVAYSSNGQTWTITSPTSINQWSNVYFKNNMFIALAYYGETQYSFDGINWTQGQSLPGASWGLKRDSVVLINNTLTTISGSGATAVSTDGINWTFGDTLSGFQFLTLKVGNISTLVEVQVSIGDQGSGGAEVVVPVDVYVVPSGKTTTIDKIEIRNTSSNTVSIDLAFLNDGVPISDENALINDANISGQYTQIYDYFPDQLTEGQRIVVFPSTVDVIEVKVYGTES